MNYCGPKLTPATRKAVEELLQATEGLPPPRIITHEGYTTLYWKQGSRLLVVDALERGRLSICRISTGRIEPPQLAGVVRALFGEDE